MPEYPEHEKLAAVKDQSQAIGEFLDFGLSRIGGGLVLYEHVTRGCECSSCLQGAGYRDRWHTEEEKATCVDGVVQIADCQPTFRTIDSILTDYFDIDQDKIEAEKRAMLDKLREMNAR
jgi:hypothetical protein